MVYLCMILSWAAELLALFPVILAARTPGTTAFCLGAGTALWLLSWRMAQRPLPFFEKAAVLRKERRKDGAGKPGGVHSPEWERGPETVCSGNIFRERPVCAAFYFLSFWTLLSQAAVFLRLAADLLAETLWPKTSPAVLCLPAFFTVLAGLLLWKYRRKRTFFSGKNVRFAKMAAAFCLAFVLMLPVTAAALTTSVRTAEGEPQEFAVLAAADVFFPDTGLHPVRKLLPLLLLAGLLLAAAVSYLGLQNIVQHCISRKTHSAFSGLWPLAIVLPLLLACGFRGWPSVTGWYCAYLLQTLIPATGVCVVIAWFLRKTRTELCL